MTTPQAARAGRPRISVICAVYQGAAHLQPTLDGLRRQSSDDFEAVFVDDASTDDTPDRLAAIGDPRFVVVRNDRNLGVVAARNRALSIARADYVAVSDHDDPSHPTRLALQADWLDAHPRASAVYTQIRSIDASGRVRDGVSAWAYSGQQARAALVFHNFVSHSTLMFRRDRASDPVYTDDYPLCEDYWLLVRLADSGDGLHAIRRALVDYRYHDRSHSRATPQVMAHHAIRLQRTLLGRLGLDPSEAELALHAGFSGGRDGMSLRVMRESREWLAHVADANLRMGYVPSADFDAVVAAVWLELSHKFARHGRAAWNEYSRGPRGALGPEHRWSEAKLWMKCAWRRPGRHADASGTDRDDAPG